MQQNFAGRLVGERGNLIGTNARTQPSSVNRVENRRLASPEQIPTVHPRSVLSLIAGAIALQALVRLVCEWP
jgi:hypothetical protein